MTLQITRGKRGYYWALVARNGRKVALGGEPFATRASALRSVRNMLVKARTRFFYGFARLK